MSAPGGFGVVLHRSAIALFALGEPSALLALDDADMQAYTVLVPMAGYAEVYRTFGGTEPGGPLLDALLDIGVVVDAPLDRPAARGAALTTEREHELTEAETAWHARRRGWPVLVAPKVARALSTAFPDLTVMSL